MSGCAQRSLHGRLPGLTFPEGPQERPDTHSPGALPACPQATAPRRHTTSSRPADCGRPLEHAPCRSASKRSGREHTGIVHITVRIRPRSACPAQAAGTMVRWSSGYASGRGRSGHDGCPGHGGRRLRRPPSPGDADQGSVEPNQDNGRGGRRSSGARPSPGAVTAIGQNRAPTTGITAANVTYQSQFSWQTCVAHQLADHMAGMACPPSGDARHSSANRSATARRPDRGRCGRLSHPPQGVM
jgi:hypothetical protein